MQHKIVHGKNNPYSDLYLIILMIALELCWWWLLIEHSLCPGRHLYSQYPGRHLCPSVPVCNFSLSVPFVIYIPCVPVVICVPVSRSVIYLWVSRSSFISPGRYLCPSAPVCNFSLSVPVVIYIPCVPAFSFLFLLYFSVFFLFLVFFFFSF